MEEGKKRARGCAAIEVLDSSICVPHSLPRSPRISLKRRRVGDGGWKGNTCPIENYEINSKVEGRSDEQYSFKGRTPNNQGFAFGREDEEEEEIVSQSDLTREEDVALCVTPKRQEQCEENDSKEVADDIDEFTAGYADVLEDVDSVEGDDEIWEEDTKNTTVETDSRPHVYLLDSDGSDTGADPNSISNDSHADNIVIEEVTKLSSSCSSSPYLPQLFSSSSSYISSSSSSSSSAVPLSGESRRTGDDQRPQAYEFEDKEEEVRGEKEESDDDVVVLDTCPRPVAARPLLAPRHDYTTRAAQQSIDVTQADEYAILSLRIKGAGVEGGVSMETLNMATVGDLFRSVARVIPSCFIAPDGANFQLRCLQPEVNLDLIDHGHLQMRETGIRSGTCLHITRRSLHRSQRWPIGTYSNSHSTSPAPSAGRSSSRSNDHLPSPSPISPFHRPSTIHSNPARSSSAAYVAGWGSPSPGTGWESLRRPNEVTRWWRRERGHGSQDPLDSMSYEQLLAIEERMGTVKTGLKGSEIRSLPKIKYEKKPSESEGDGEVCCVCQGVYKQRQHVRVLPCTHYFHPLCIDKWLRMKPTCPVCMERVRT